MINKRNYHWPLGLVWIKEEDSSWDGQTIELTGPGRKYLVRFVNTEVKHSWLKVRRSSNYLNFIFTM